MSEFEPKIVAFLCNWCSYAGADHAGSMRKPHPANIRVIRVMCSGRVESQFILKAFLEGADGVLVCGCHPGDCHYTEGNYKAARKMRLLRRTLDQLGVEEARFRLDWISAAESDKFVTVMNETAEAIKALGPLVINTAPFLETAVAEEAL